MHIEGDRSIGAIARRQHGVFSRRQAVAVGFTRDMVRWRLERGTWIRMDVAVFALASHPFTWERRVMAAALSVRGAVVSGRSAAALHGIDGFARGGVDLIVPPGSNERSRLATVHRSNFVQSELVRGIPTLTVAHTLLDLASTVSSDRLADAVDRCLTRRLVEFDDLSDLFVLHAAGRRPGTRVLRQILLTRSAETPEPPMTELERLLRRMLTADGLPEFRYEVEVGWWPPGEGRVDGYASSCALIVEADGRRWHTRERDFVKDRRRDNLATANGHGVLRFPFDDLAHSIEACRDLVRKTARARGWTSSHA